MADVTITHVLACSEDTFWDKLVFDDEFNRGLYKERLKFPVFDVKKHEDTGDEIRRVTTVVPRLGDLPAPIKKVVGDNMGYEERGVFDKKSRRYKFDIEPNKLADKLGIRGEMYTEPAGDNKCKRTFKATVTAKVFGIGGMLEKRIIEDLQKSYDIGARFTNDYVAEKGM